jgi:Zn-finger nucleic acid-binding protein
MTCPKCSSPMQVVVIGGVEIDRCTRCAGIWFDLVEEKRVLRAGGAAKVDTGHAATEPGPSAVTCPRCETPLLRMVDAGQPHIWYESCAVCYGTFFDAGEFRDLADESLGDLFKRWGAKERT